MRRILWLTLFCLPLGCGRPYDYLRGDAGEGDGSANVDPFGDGGVNVGVRSCDSTVTFKPTTPASKVAIAGEWNKFSTTAQPLVKGTDGSWSVTLQLPAGEHGYKLVADGANWSLDPANPYYKYVDGTINSDLRVPDCKAPLLTLADWRVDQAARTLDAKVSLLDGHAAKGIDPASLSVTIDGKPLAPTDGTLGVRFDAGKQQLVLHADMLVDGKHTVRVNVKEKGGLAASELYLPLWIQKTEFQWKDSLIYFAMVDRFVNGNPANDMAVPGVVAQGNFFGGDWAGLKQKIDKGYFDSLGVNVIWVSGPNLQATGPGIGSDGRNYSGYHGYWPIDATQTDPHFGTSAELKAVVDSAHARGIRILIDFVANHTHIQHPWWTQKMGTPYYNPLLKQDGSKCLCGAGCSWDPPEGIACWFNEYLPDLNYTDQDALVAISDNALYWLKESGADGLRVDAVKQMPHILGNTLRARLHDELELTGVPTYMVGETYVFTWTQDPNQGQNLLKQYVGPRELHGQFDFPLHWEMVSAFASDNSFKPLESVLSQEYGFYGTDAVMSPFLGNQDLPRFVSLANGDPVSQEDGYKNPPPAPANALPYSKLKLGMTLLLTIPGAPLIYYGDEIGMPGAADPDNRRMMRFDTLSTNEQSTLIHIQKLGKLRLSDESLRRGDYKTLWVDDQVLVYARHVAGSAARIVALNHTDQTQTRPVPVPDGLGITDGMKLKDALGGAEITPQAKVLNVNLPARTGAVYVP